MDNLAQNMTQTIDENSIFTCYRITGGDDIQIAEVNPNGTNKIYNFEYYLPYMSTELQSKIKSYNAKYQELKPKYEDIVKRLGDQIYVIQELNTKYPDSLASTDWTQYGLSGLATYKKSYETQDQLFCAQGMNKPTSLNYNLYTQNLDNLNAVTAEYNKRVSEIDAATSVYQDILAEMKALQSELDMDKWFTEDEWKTLDSYVIEQTYTNDNFGAVDNTTESELFDMEKELYDIAWKDLSKKCRPQYQYSSTLTNILTIPEFKDFVKYFELGNFIQMKTDYDTVIRLRIISFTVDYNNTQNIAVTFSDAIRVHEFYDDTGSIQAQANSAAMSFKFNKDQYDSTVKQGNFVAEMRKYGLDVATIAIHNASNQNQTWDDTGFTFRKWNDERQDYDPEMIKIINNMMVFLDSDGARMAIGKISLPNGNSCYGINCELLVNKLTMSENVWIENDSGTYKFDDAGFNASDGINTVKIQPNNSGELFSIYKGSNKQFYINSDGDVEFAGSLKSASGQFAGLVSGGSINIGNGVFTVDKNGNMYSSSGTFAGLVSGGEINIGNGTFTVDKNGKMTATNASLSGSVTASDGSIGGWKIDSTRILSPRNFNIYLDSSTGTINGATIISSGVNGTTTISGGGISSTGANGMSNVISLLYGNHCTYLRPNGLAIMDTTSTEQYLLQVGSNVIDLSYRNFSGSDSAYTSSSTRITNGNIDTNYITINERATINDLHATYLTVYNPLIFTNRCIAYGTSSGTENSKVYKVSTGGDDDIPSANWVKNYVANKYVTDSEFDERIERVKQWVRDNFKRL